MSTMTLPQERREIVDVETAQKYARLASSWSEYLARFGWALRYLGAGL